MPRRVLKKVVPSQRSSTSQIVPSTVADPSWPSVRKLPWPLPQSLPAVADLGRKETELAAARGEAPFPFLPPVPVFVVGAGQVLVSSSSSTTRPEPSLCFTRNTPPKN